MKIKTQNTFNEFMNQGETTNEAEFIKLIINGVCFCFVKNEGTLRVEVESYEY